MHTLSALCRPGFYAGIPLNPTFGRYSVANIKSQKKRIKTAEKARLRNRAVRSSLKTAVKKVHLAVEQGDKTLAQTRANEASRLLDKAASKGIIHKNQAAQRKSGVQKLVNTLG